MPTRNVILTDHQAELLGIKALRDAARLAAIALAGALLLASACVEAAPPPDGNGMLRVYFVDVEGGQATLFVTPEGQSLLIDTGWPGNEARDAERIVAAARGAGVKQLNYVLITHFHLDHVGGVPQLAARIPIEAFIDHGANRESENSATAQGYRAYEELLASGKYKRITLKPGDLLPIRGVSARVISSDGALIRDHLPGAGQPNAACGESEQRPADKTENLRSLGTLISFGKLKILDLGDLTWDKEMELMCPLNKLGAIDVFIVSHHGWYQSNSPALVHAIAPRVAIMDNGAKKGATPSAWDIIAASPHLENIWQLHFSDEGGTAHNAAPEFIANPEGPDAGNYLQLDGNLDGSFDVFNSRTQATKHYAAPRARR